MKALDKAIERIERQAVVSVEALADRYRTSHVIPYCDRHGLRFTAGMGEWSFDDGNGNYCDSSDLPKRLSDVLTTSVLNGRQGLGSLMLDYVPPNYKG